MEGFVSYLKTWDGKLSPLPEWGFSHGQTSESTLRFPGFPIREFHSVGSGVKLLSFLNEGQLERIPIQNNHFLGVNLGGLVAILCQVGCITAFRNVLPPLPTFRISGAVFSCAILFAERPQNYMRFFRG